VTCFSMKGEIGSKDEKTQGHVFISCSSGRGGEGGGIQFGRGGCHPCRQNGSPGVSLLCVGPPSKSTSLSQRVCSVAFVYQEFCHSSWPMPLSTAPTATNVPICGLDLAVAEPSPTVPGVPPPGFVPNSAYVTTISSRPVTIEQGATCTIVEEGYAHAVVVVFIPEDECRS
jgi:hypothetical protein